MRAAAYLRKSTAGSDAEGIERQEGSFDRQRMSILDYAKRRNIEIVKWYEEPVSGKSIRKRKVFLQMVQDAKSPARPFKAILFGEYDRFMRDVKEAMRYEVEFDDHGIELHFTNFQNNDSDAEGAYKDMYRRMAANYSKELARKTIQGMYRKARSGSWLGGIPPYGLKRTTDPTGAIRLEVHPKEAAVIRQIFEKALADWGHKRIAVWLNQRGIPASEAAKKRNSISNRNPDGRWTVGTIYAIVRNPIYKGLYRWNKRARVDCFDWKLEGQGTVEVGKIRARLDEFKGPAGLYMDRTKPEADWVTREGIVPAIIKPADFDRLQTRFQKRVSWTRGNERKYLMAGALRCRSCGNGCYGHRYNKKRPGTGERVYYEYYRCGGDVKKGTHAKSSKPMIKREAIDSIVMDGILRRAEQFADPEKVRVLFQNRIEQYLKDTPDRLADIEKELCRLEREAARLAEVYSKLDQPLPEERIREIRAHRLALEGERQTLLHTGAHRLRMDGEREAKEFFARASTAPAILAKGGIMDKIRLRERFLKQAEVEWSPERPPKVFLAWYKLPVSLLSTRTGPPPPFNGKLVDPLLLDAPWESYEYRGCVLVPA